MRFSFICKALIIALIAAPALLSPVGCAKSGTPEGGPRDTIPPVVVRTVPENYSVNFDADEIRIYFDEYVRLNNPTRQMVVSPPFDNPPDITPIGSAKFIRIKINDTLKPNTTYVKTLNTKHLNINCELCLFLVSSSKFSSMFLKMGFIHYHHIYSFIFHAL